MDWAVLHLPAADEATIRATFASHLLKLNEGRDLGDEYGSSSILQKRMCLVVDDEVVESAARGPKLDELDNDDNKNLERNVFVKVFDVNHPPATYEVVAISGRLPIPSNQVRYEGWTKATPRSLYDLYDSAICRCNGYGRGFCGPDEIHDW